MTKLETMYFNDGVDYSTIYWVYCPTSDRDYDAMIDDIDKEMPGWWELSESEAISYEKDGAKVVPWTGAAQ